MNQRAATHALLVGPLPPPVGGIATMISKLLAAPDANRELVLLDTRKRPGQRGIAALQASVRLAMRLASSLGRGPRRALVFSSAYASFWEKALWLGLARLRGVPMAVMMVDGNFPDFHRRLSRPLRGLTRRVLESFEFVIVQTESWRNYYAGIAPAARLVVAANGVDPEEFPPCRRRSGGEPVILFVGWLIPAKGIFDLIEAAAILQARGLSFRVELLGPDHGYNEELQRRIEAAGLGGSVTLRAELHSRADLLRAYCEGDIFTLPSWAEGLPNALMEAMACGLVAVAAAVGGIPDLIEDGVTGRLVPPRDPARLADALSELLVDASLRQRLGEAGSRRIATSFSNAAFVTRLRELLRAPAASRSR